MEFATLDKIHPDSILETFNRSFINYFVPLQLTPVQLKDKMAADNTILKLSAGCFCNNQLVGFILHGTAIINGVLTAYNGGTGVIPEYRGQQITNKMYDFILPLLKTAGAGKCVLEVIDRNEHAIRSYTQTGFRIKRSLAFFKGKIRDTCNEADIREITVPDWSRMQSFRDWDPSWQNSVFSIQNLETAYKKIGFYKGGQLIGYLVYNPVTNRIVQFAVDKNHRRQGIGKILFSCTGTGQEVSVSNIDTRATGTIQFLESLELKPVITQYEMELTIR